MKVVMFSEYPYSEAEQGLGGVMQATFQLVEGFSALNLPDLELHVITTSNSCLTREVRRSGNIVCHFVPRAKSTLGHMVVSPLRLLRYSWQVINKIHPDLIHGQGTVTYLFLSLFLGKCNVQTVHGLYRNEQAAIPKDQQSAIVRLKFAVKLVLERWYLRQIRNLIAITSQIVQVMTDEGNQDVRVFNINNAIDRAFFDLAEKRIFAAASRDSINILFVAAITPRKGLHVLVEAFKRLEQRHPNIQLTVVGIWDWAPDYVQEQSAACRELQAKGRVVFTGGLGRERLIQAFDEADIFVLPSFSESAPMVISQAMCVGLPIVTTRVGGIPEMIEQGLTGVMLEPGDVDALTVELARLIENPAARQQLATAAREVGFTRYHPESIARATAAAYHEVIVN
jgi:glycosyltransferase involved in cell wall biosynthesis